MCLAAPMFVIAMAGVIGFVRELLIAMMEIMVLIVVMPHSFIVIEENLAKDAEPGVM
jgi:hypothetical protein